VPSRCGEDTVREDKQRPLRIASPPRKGYLLDLRERRDTMSPIDDARFPTYIVANCLEHFEPHDVLYATNAPRVTEPPVPTSPAEESRLSRVTEILATYRQMKPVEQSTALSIDRYRFRMSSYQGAVRSALRVVWDDPFLSGVYWWAFPSATDWDVGAPSALHGAVLAVLADDQVTDYEHKRLAGAWEMVLDAMADGRWSAVDWPDTATGKQNEAIIYRLRNG
jgi:hypothetical protein